MASRLLGKVAIVTGAGSRGPGIGNGKATAVLFARGAKVLCVDQDLGRADETCGIVASDGGEASAFAADVSRSADCAAIVGGQSCGTLRGASSLFHDGAPRNLRHSAAGASVRVSTLSCREPLKIEQLGTHLSHCDLNSRCSLTVGSG